MKGADKSADENGAKSAAKEVGAGLRSILERVADFFDLFDLSFIVSGSVAIGATYFWIAIVGRFPFPTIGENWIRVAVLIVSSYVAGLVCFATARYIRQRFLYRRLDTTIVKVLSGHDLSETPSFSAYLGRDESLRGPWRLYARLWAEVRHDSASSPSFTLLRRLWVMAATYDGLSVALGLWALALLWYTLANLQTSTLPYFSGVGTALALLACFVCHNEARRYVEDQVETLIATVAAGCSRRENPLFAPGTT